jgi:hypothetical protein
MAARGGRWGGRSEVTRRSVTVTYRAQARNPPASQGALGKYARTQRTDGVVAGEAVAGQRDLHARHKVVHADGGGEVLEHHVVAVSDRRVRLLAHRGGLHAAGLARAGRAVRVAAGAAGGVLGAAQAGDRGAVLGGQGAQAARGLLAGGQAEGLAQHARALDLGARGRGAPAGGQQDALHGGCGAGHLGWDWGICLGLRWAAGGCGSGAVGGARGARAVDPRLQVGARICWGRAFHGHLVPGGARLSACSFVRVGGLRPPTRGAFNCV